MKASLSSKEPETLERWQEEKLYERMREAHRGRKLFILHDGPPYANGRIHIGHALNKILKDIIVRHKMLRGFDAPYVPGWDCHGLPVEHQLFKDLKKNKDEIDRVAFRKLAHDYALKYVGIQRDEFKRLGILGEWERPYLTLDKTYEKAILESFGELVEKGYIYRGLKPVNWCFRCETALAEAEVEYADHESDSVFVKFRLLDDVRSAALGAGDRDVYVVIWTTTPWTLMANVAVAVHPDLNYCLVDSPQGVLLVSKDLFEATLAEKFGLKDAPILKVIEGRKLEGLRYVHPFGLREGRVVLADYVSREEGSGCVHTAPGHGQEDFMTGVRYQLETVMPVDSAGRFDEGGLEFCGVHVFDANARIIEKLRGLGALLQSGKLNHTYPHCWRCKQPVIFRATHQWFLKIDHEDLRQKVLSEIDRVQWVPASGRERIAAMVQNRPDWCLSRQRYWGVPIPAVICKACGHQLLDARLIKKFAAEVAGEGTDIWFKKDISAFLPAGLTCSCGGSDFEKSTDILDVWFDSGVSHQAVLKNSPRAHLPADLYLEGSDQHRGWFQASLIPSMAIDGRAPFAAVLTHGFVVDGDGRKMSKSLGNVIAPQEIIKDFGADILRLWVLSSDYNEDVRISKGILSFVADAYRKIRNTARFLLGNLHDFNPDTDVLQGDEMLDIDRWVLWRLTCLLEDVSRDYDAYRFYHVFQRIYAFCNEELSSLYLDILKDRLYTAAKRSVLRRSAQTALYEILQSLVRILAPVIPFTAEEIYQAMRRSQSDDAESVHLCVWPLFKEEHHIDPASVAAINRILEQRSVILKALEEKRAAGGIGSSLEAAIVLRFKDRFLFKTFLSYQEQLPFVFIVSQVECRHEADLCASLQVDVQKAAGQKCARCWNYSVDTDADAAYPGLCGRCVRAVRED